MAFNSVAMAGSTALIPSFSSSSSSSSSYRQRPSHPLVACVDRSQLDLSSCHSLFGAQLYISHAVPIRATVRPHGLLSPLIRASQGSTERSYVMVKPDGVQRGLVGDIISRFERKGFVIKGLKLFRCSTELAEEHYKDLSSKPFFPKLVQYITSGPVVCLALEGPGVVASARKLIGVTNPLQAEPGTIRGDLGIETGRNVIHGSDSPENGEREIALWFKEGELCEWEPTMTPWLRE